MHFISEIVDPEQFPSKFIQTFKEKFESEVNARNRQRKQLETKAEDGYRKSTFGKEDSQDRDYLQHRVQLEDAPTSGKAQARAW